MSATNYPPKEILLRIEDELRQVRRLAAGPEKIAAPAGTEG